MTLPVTNISCYQFAHLSDLKPLRERLTALCRGWELKGTILLSPEGINLFVAGDPDRIEDLLTELRRIPGLETLRAKYSESEGQPFNRMLVRMKKEIIAFGVEGIDPAVRTSPKLPARTLKQWLDEGRKVVLYDTRNDYEVKLGTFANALPAGIDHFRQFPDAVRQLPEEMKDQPIVMFCTGGIRCEKAGPFMEREGFKHVYQLEGGILKYFEECGGDHYDGECFVFDQRVGVGPDLEETESAQCYACQSPLRPEDLEHPHYARGQHCPYCWQEPEEVLRATLEKRQDEISRLAASLPGCEPYENFRPLKVRDVHEGMRLLEFLTTVMPHSQEETWSRICQENRILNHNKAPLAADAIVRAGQRLIHKVPGTVEPLVNPNIRILHEDTAIIVIDKPAPLPMHPSGRFNRNTLQYFLATVYHPQKPKPAHRLDANTTGLVVLSRTHAFASRLQPQFTRGEVEKVYLAKVQGHPQWESFTCQAAISDEPGPLGSREIDPENGRSAATAFKVLRRNDDGTTLIEARPLTGRTNQIRIHLRHLGHPIVGDATYLPGGTLGDLQTLETTHQPLCLHSSKVKFRHPLTTEWVAFASPPPEWAE